MKTLRLIHLYLGCFFAPLLLFFVISGCWQTFALHVERKDGTYRPPAVLKLLSEVHMNEIAEGSRTSLPFRLVVVAMSLGLLVTTSLGIIMAFRFSKSPNLVWLALTAGVLVPLGTVILERGLR